ncbi:MAG: alanine--glyoxylate aminotransferase family protein [Thermotogae bacterium]|nr:alanine--glyoxylate aminotransferase family protein [Thermotogota bacterium]
MHKKLFLPGPVEVLPEILERQSLPLVGHRSKEFSQIYERVIGNLKKLFNTDYYTFVFTSSGTGVLEGFIRNFVKKRILIPVNGSFSKRWVEAALLNGKEVKAIEIEWGKAVKPEMVEEELKTGKYDAFMVVHNESSTGLTNPLKELAEMVRSVSPDTLVLVDAVSGMLGVPLELEGWGVDAVAASVQKAFGLPPGISVAYVSSRAMKRSEEVENRGMYFNFERMWEYYRKKRQTPFTPNISLIYALDYQLGRILKEGLENRYERHKKMAEMAQRWAQNRFDMFPERGYWSRTITCVKNTRKIKVAEMLEELERRGYVIANGYGPLREKTFRIGHMGDLTPEDLEELLGTIDEILKDKGWLS